MVKPSLTTVDIVASSSISVEQSATSPSVSVVHAWIVCDALDDHGAFEKLVLSHGIACDCVFCRAILLHETLQIF